MPKDCLYYQLDNGRGTLVHVHAAEHTYEGWEAIDEYARCKEKVESSEDRVRALENELNQAVCGAYEIDEETINFVRERVKRPTNPLEPKAMK